MARPITIVIDITPHLSCPVCHSLGEYREAHGEWFFCDCVTSQLPDDENQYSIQLDLSHILNWNEEEENS